MSEPMQTLSVGDVAPDFVLPDGMGQLVSLSQFRGQRLVLYFYPRDSTPGCTKEACSFRDSAPAYQAQGIQVLGISTDGSRSHVKFAEKYGLPFPLLSDEGAEVARSYGVYGPKKFMGKTYEGITRTTFVIDADGQIEQVYGGTVKGSPKIKVETHAQDILQRLQNLSD